jgi:multimeric flavodoxin WrbA
MQICVVYGSERKESTYNLVKIFLKELNADSIEEYFLPKDLPYFCKGCAACIMKGESYCPHKEYVLPIAKSLENADIIIFATPVYVMRASGQMKVLLDHFAYQFMVHRPNEKMFKKKGLIISTAAGGGMKSAIKDIKESFDFWGIGKTYKYGKAVNALAWDEVTDEKRIKINKEIKKISKEILKKEVVKPSFKVRALFFIMGKLQKKYKFNEIDVKYWEEKDWFSGKKPW